MVGDSGKAVDEVMIQPQEPFRLSHPHFAIFQYHDSPGSLLGFVTTDAMDCHVKGLLC